MTPKDDDRYEHPMKQLAQRLGKVEYPVPVSDTWIPAAIALLPCAALVAISVLWPPGAPFFLAIAGAFLSIQLATPYNRFWRAVGSFVDESRRLNVSSVSRVRDQIAFHTDSVWYQGGRPVGYSRLGYVFARRRFRKLARRWDRNFWRISGRVVGPETADIGPAAVPSWRYVRYKGFDWRRFVRRGRRIPTRVGRGLLGLVPLAVIHVWSLVMSSNTVVNYRERAATRLLTNVGRELIRASRRRDGDEAVRTLAKQIDIEYTAPTIEDSWVFSETHQALVSETNPETSFGESPDTDTM